uniref:dTDP-4-dehydrorhamnose 3,5-epimerase n=1 Tax=Parascaris equorum TaxID=6256 RepID=A0A914RXK6_PAREQ
MSVSDVVKRAKVEIETIEDIPDLKLIRPKVFPDERGFFSESYNIDEWSKELGFNEVFKQDNHSFSKFVDIRRGSATYGKWHAVILDGKTNTNFWIPDGFLHGFYTLSPEGAHVVYKCTAVYDPTTELGVNPFDGQIDVTWPIANKDAIIISERDKSHQNLNDIRIL